MQRSFIIGDEGQIITLTESANGREVEIAVRNESEQTSAVFTPAEIAEIHKVTSKYNSEGDYLRIDDESSAAILKAETKRQAE